VGDREPAPPRHDRVHGPENSATDYDYTSRVIHHG
jgi:hypothetical protein